MNWYKKAQSESKWKVLIATFGIIAILALASNLGLKLSDLKKVYEKNPQKIEQALKQTKQDKDLFTFPKKPSISISPEKVPIEETIKPIFKSKFPGIDIAKMIERHEGKRNVVYIDTQGNPTVGIGFNLNRIDAREKLSNLGLDINKILEGKSLTNEQIYKLFKEDLERSIIDAHRFLPNFSQQPIEIQAVLIDMAFNLGYSRLSNFVKFKEALLNKNYSIAAEEMINSKWYNQTGNRSKELVSIVRGVK